MVFLPRHLSVSSVELYARCAAQWKRRYVDRIIDPPNRAMAWGTAFHKALEAVHTADPDADYELTWLRTWNAMQAEMGRDFWPNKSYGLDLLEQFHARGLAVKCPAEVKFSLPFPGGAIPVPLLGYIDATPPDDTREYKTTKGGWWNETRAQMSHQAHVYGWVRQRTRNHRRPVRFVIFGTRVPTITEYIVEPSPDGFRVFEQLAEGVWKGISEARYDGCGDCFVCTPGSTKVAADDSRFDWDLS
jgi:hypothetical protein